MTSSQPLTDWVAPSSPGPDRPLGPRVERLARAVRGTAAQLERQVDVPFEDLYRPTRTGLGFTLPAEDICRRSAWALLGEWLVACSTRASCAQQGLAAVHQWFWRRSDRDLGTFPDLHVAIEVEDSVEIRALLPYLLDPRAAATRRDVLNTRSSPQERQMRKDSGIYYTPGDVAHMMVKRLLPTEALVDSETWLDPAHGSGVFLRAVFCALGGKSQIADQLYGIDLDPVAAEATSFVLTAEDLVRNPSAVPPWERWHRFRKNLVTGDTLMLEASPTAAQASLDIGNSTNDEVEGPLGTDRPWRLQGVFSETAERGIDHVIANPPYAALPKNKSRSLISALHPITGKSANADISPVFVELCANILQGKGSMAVVLPLSVVSSTRAPFPALRQFLVDQPGRLDLLSFDRVPDALFGDDVKTRNAIVYLEKGLADELTTTALHRWTSRTRSRALGASSAVSIADLPGVPNVIPKIGTSWERELLIAVEASRWQLDHWYTGRRQLPLGDVTRRVAEEKTDLLAVAPTAYNFLGIVRDPFRAVTEGHDSHNPYSILRFDSTLRASAAYALLSSRVAFWIWQVMGDGFHVTNALLQRVPVPWENEDLTEQLAELGDELWKMSLQSPTLSLNRGRTTIAYASWRETDLLNEIDASVGEVLGVDVAQLVTWYERLVVVDPDSVRRNEKLRKKQQ